ncbi:zinc-finger-containing protein [Pseudooceanicola atlanticus]|uniref:Uncharacterized protein n=1 Tax=Pseudooceanicola atlanticus TaxID=1461694 RepID=A0A0A0EI44_9RHOB|nr:hypothetical protein ATO9_03925 [Pseudooceanicola atlanticus]
MTTKAIHCCGCGLEVAARLTNGAEVYPHRSDLAKLPFWRCDACGNWVGCHHKTKNRTNPLGCIPTPELKAARQHIHRVLDPIWQSGDMERGEVYRAIESRLGMTTRYHTAQIRTVDEARQVYTAVRDIAAENGGAVIE